ncbi:MAG: DUF4288 domain-containing protein [Cyanobacteria bacterium J06559_3]
MTVAINMQKNHHASQLSPVGWYIASYIERIDPVEVYEQDSKDHHPWIIRKNRILVKAFTPEEAWERTIEHLADFGYDYTNPDGVHLRTTVVGLTSLVPIYDALEDGCEIEWIDRTGETIMDIRDRILEKSELEAFTVPSPSSESFD